jgi:hypothetical protein
MLDPKTSSPLVPSLIPTLSLSLHTTLYSLEPIAFDFPATSRHIKQVQQSLKFLDPFQNL